MPLLFIIIALSACTKKDSTVVVNDSVKAEKDEKVVGDTYSDAKSDTQKLSTTSATSKIQFVDKKYTEFWDTIKYNNIDKEYNNTRVKKNNIRLTKKANIKYADNWLDELDKTYKYMCEGADKDLLNVLEKQYKSFMKYYDASKSLYLGVITVNNNYDAVIDGKDSVKQFYSLADEVRAYTIMLKEYIFIKTGKVEFYTEKTDTKKQENKYSNNANKIIVSVVSDTRFKDILNDHYNNKLNCSLKKLNEKKAVEKTKNYSKYWKDEINNNYNELKDIFNNEDKEMLKEQKDAYMEFVSKSLALNKKYMEKSKRYTKKYKDSFKVDNNLYRGRAYIKYNTLLMEYYYMITEKIEL